MGLDKEKIKREVNKVLDNTTKEDALKVKRNFKKFLRFYNSMCISCKRKAMSKPSMTIDEYCNNCQLKWKEIADEEWK